MSDDVGLAWALRYAEAGMRVFPIDARNRPLVRWKEAATADPTTIEGWFAQAPHIGLGWAIPEGIVVVDLDEKGGKRGTRDFQRLDGRSAHDVATPQATTPSGGLHLIFAATRSYKNMAPAIVGTGVDTRALGGLIALPLPGNGREWLRPLIGAELLPAPAWLDCALRTAPQARAPLILAPRAALVPPSSDSQAQRGARAKLAQACARIAAAPCGAQDATRHAQCFYIGGLVARGDLGYEEAFVGLLVAARAMPAHREPWRDLETRVARSLESGIGRPLALSETEQWVHNFRARMRLKRSGTRHG